MSRASGTKRTKKGPGRTGVKRRLLTKGGRRLTAAVPGTLGDPAAAELESWVEERLTRAVVVAREYHDDFLKSRDKDPLTAGVRARIRTKLDSYATRLEELSTAFRSPPDELRPQLTHLEATARGKQLLAIFFQVSTLLEEIRRAIESARSRLAAPLSEEEEHKFWSSIEQIGVALESLRKFIDDTFALIADERLAATEADQEFAQDPDELEGALLRLRDAIETFSRGIGGLSSTAPPSVPDYLNLISHYRSSVDRVRETIDTLFPVLPESARIARARTGEEPLAAHVGKLRSMLDVHVHFLCTALAAREACRTNLPRSADDAALRIREAISDIGIATARIDIAGGDELARCDTLPETDLPDYETLAGWPKEGGQLRAIIDSLLDLYSAGGPEQTMTAKKIAARAALLGRHRGVKGLSEATVRVKLKKLVEEMQLVRKFALVKTKTNQNASDEYRLSIPAQKKFASHAAAVRAEFEHITALSPAADPLD